ncbi:hypothetical protein Hanom_Chr14g01251291 [Helianthus anomalus]
MPVGVLEDKRKISQFTLAWRLHNIQHGYTYFEGELLYEKLQGFGIAMKTQVKILLT